MNQNEFTREFDAGVEAVRGGTDVFPMFFRDAIKNERKSLEAGRPVFDTVEMITIVIPGDPGNSPTRLVNDHDKVRFRAAWERFEREEEMAVDGTPVEAWPRLTLRQAYELKHNGFYTVESIANCSDANLRNLGLGGLSLREFAQAYIEAAKIGGVPERLVAENTQLRNEMDVMTRTIEALRHQIEKIANEKGIQPHTINVAEVTDTAVSEARETVASNKAGDLPEDWQDRNFKELKEMCDAVGAAVSPRNKSEALKILGEYQGRRDALR